MKLIQRKNKNKEEGPAPSTGPCRTVPGARQTWAARSVAS